MIWKTLAVVFSLLILISNPTGSASAFWIDNHWRDSIKKQPSKPVHWRQVQAHTPQLKTTGLNTLLLSGSGQPTLKNLLWLKKYLGVAHPIYLLDLRQETHLYVDGLPLSLYYKKDAINWGKTPAQINAYEQAWTKQLMAQRSVIVNRLNKPTQGYKYPSAPIKIPVKRAVIEQDLSQQAGLVYFRLAVPDYHPPTPRQVDWFIQFVSHLPKNTWLHIHCAAGKGRTTTFMAMRDMLANAKRVSFVDIIQRQEKLGGINLLATSKSKHSLAWKDPYNKARMDYIRLFYNYVQTDALLKEPFSKWIAHQPIGPYRLILKSSAYGHDLCLSLDSARSKIKEKNG